MVVSKSWSAFISPRPLKRCSGTPSRRPRARRGAGPRTTARRPPSCRAHLERRRAGELLELLVDAARSCGTRGVANMSRAQPVAWRPVPVLRSITIDDDLASRPGSTSSSRTARPRATRRLEQLDQPRRRRWRPRRAVRRLLEEADRRRGPTRPAAATAQPSYCLSRRPNFCQRACVRLERRFPSRSRDLHLLELVAQQDLLELGLLLDVDVLLAGLDLVERRLRDVHVAGVDQLGHLAEQEGEHQRADVRAVHVGVASSRSPCGSGPSRCRTPRGSRCRSR